MREGLREGGEGAGEGRGADLGAAAAAEGFGPLGRADAAGDFGGEGWRGHGLQVREAGHEAAVDAVLEAPDVRAFEGDAVALAHRRLAAEGDELEVISLRFEGFAGRS